MYRYKTTKIAGKTALLHRVVPDGSRRVDAMAKAACWRALVAEVLRG